MSALGVDVSIKVDVWSDVQCPWCYIGKRKFEAAVEQTGIPVEVESLVARCLAKDPSQRPPTSNELALELGALLERFPSTTARNMQVAAPIATPMALQATTLSSVASQLAPPAQEKRHRGRLMLAAIVSVATVIVAWVALSSGDGHGQPGETLVPAIPAAAPAPQAVPADAAALQQVDAPTDVGEMPVLVEKDRQLETKAVKRVNTPPKQLGRKGAVPPTKPELPAESKPPSEPAPAGSSPAATDFDTQLEIQRAKLKRKPVVVQPLE